MSELPRFATDKLLAVILGASSYPKAPDLADGKPFLRSANDMREYLWGDDGLGLAFQNVKWLFDDPRSPADQLEEMRDFLTQRSSDPQSRPSGLIVFYVGHGLFTSHEQAYCLAIRQTTTRNEGPTSLRTSDLASTIKAALPKVSKFLIMDCCFSAAATKDFMSNASMIARRKMTESFPERGTVILCSSSARDVSLAPAGLERTMFSDALTRVLRNGDPEYGRYLTFADLVDLVRHDLRTHPVHAIPEVHVPEQHDGSLSRVPFFPNKGHRSSEGRHDRRRPDAEAEQQSIEAQRRKREEDERIASELRERQARIDEEAERARIRRKEALEISERSRKEAEAQRKLRRRRQVRRWLYGVATGALIGVVVLLWLGSRPPPPVPIHPTIQSSTSDSALARVDVRTVSGGRQIEPRILLIAEKAYRGDASWQLDLSDIVAAPADASQPEARAFNDAGLQHLQANQLSEALSDFIIANRVDALDLEIANNLGYAGFLNGDYPVSRVALFRSLALAPRHVNAWFNLGQTLAADNQPDMGVGCFLIAYAISDNKQRTLSVIGDQRASSVPTLRDAAAQAVARINDDR